MLRTRIAGIIETRLGAHLAEEERIALERGIYNTALAEAKEHGVRRHWDNPDFAVVYKTIARRAIANIDPAAYVGNARLLERLKEGEFTADAVAAMTHRELYPEHWQALADEQLKRETTMLEGSHEEGSDMFKCKRCGKSRTRYWEMQTRSADEPMTTFVTCLECDTKWKY